MSFIDDSVLSDAIVRYIGEDRSLTPQDDITAAREAHPGEGPELESAIVHTLVRSEKIAFEDVAPFDGGLRERLYERLRHEFPRLSEPAVRAIGWRWGFLNLR
ncbi:hypothetical protein [Microbacterium sp. BH-3-3-3]|uniref:hypothetical protein n=1 Tax=Microbacterium sp. BH-3-3-3 TaxID=1906742 RepID=UPI0011A635AD|nr:hypothetical protein [Microbacterium sp. BH-3-3-3]